MRATSLALLAVSLLAGCAFLRDFSDFQIGIDGGAVEDGGPAGGGSVDAGRHLDGGRPDAGTGSQDAGMPRTDGGRGDGGGPAANLVFVTSTTQSGNLGGLAGADAICSTLAGNAGLPGTFVALLSTSTVDARNRLAGARGWVRPDGRVVADTIEDLFDGSVYHPILLTEDGERIRDVLDDPDAETVTVFTGSRADGLRRSNEAAEFCRDWTDQDPSFAVTHYYGVAASTSEDLIRREFDVGIGCRSSRRLYCFGTDQNTTVEPRRLEESEGRYAFVYGDGINEPPFDGAGCRPEDLECPPGPERPVDVFDEACAAAARSAGLPGTYRALIGTSTTAPLSRFNSNVNALPWMRLDRVPLVESASDLRRTEGLVTTPTNSAGAQPVRDVWLGSTSPDSRSTDDRDHCISWSTESSSFSRGGIAWVADDVNAFFNSPPVRCQFHRGLLCLQE